jgi:diguanylate cyclase (GGDEF)-like protein
MRPLRRTDNRGIVDDSAPESLPYATPRDLLRAPAAEYDAAADMRMVRRIGGGAWLVCALMAAGMLAAWPPRHGLGGLGWAFAAGLIGGEAGLGVYLLRGSHFSLHAAMTSSVAVILGMGLLDWVAGSPSEYTTAIVLPLIYVGATQAPWRAAASLVAGCLALAPGLAAHHVASHAVLSDAMTLVVWICLVAMALLWTAGVRWQRLALGHSQRRLQYLAMHDGITGLGNRRKLVLDLDALLASGTPAVLGLFDLNGFKSYNDTYGHPAGDALLARLGARLSDAASSGGRAYRLGGDEFVLVLDGDDADEMLSAGMRALSEHGPGVAVTAAGGAAVVPMEAGTSTDALRLADQRMYAHKQSLREGAPAVSLAHG